MLMEFVTFVIFVFTKYADVTNNFILTMLGGLEFLHLIIFVV